MNFYDLPPSPFSPKNLLAVGCDRWGFSKQSYFILLILICISSVLHSLKEHPDSADVFCEICLLRQACMVAYTFHSRTQREAILVSDQHDLHTKFHDN